MFVRGGLTYPDDSLGYAARLGNYWTSIGYDSEAAYSLSFDPSKTDHSDYVYRHYGYSLRCVALGG